MKVLLFDLGGVVINWTGLQEMQKLLGFQHSLDEVRLKMMTNPMLMKFEIGSCSAEEFARSFIKDFDLPFEEQQFLDVFAGWAGQPYQGVFNRLQELRQDYTLACLSNTNRVHWDFLIHNVGIMDVFDHCFASHLLQKAKPEPEIYHTVLQALNTAAADVCFFDDRPENVEAACGAGMKGCHVDASAGVLSHLDQIDFFDQ